MIAVRQEMVYFLLDFDVRPVYKVLRSKYPDPATLKIVFCTARTVCQWGVTAERDAMAIAIGWEFQYRRRFKEAICLLKVDPTKIRFPHPQIDSPWIVACYEQNTPLEENARRNASCEINFLRFGYEKIHDFCEILMIFMEN